MIQEELPHVCYSECFWVDEFCLSRVLLHNKAQNSVLEPIDYTHIKRSKAECIYNIVLLIALDSSVFTSPTNSHLTFPLLWGKKPLYI